MIKQEYYEVPSGPPAAVPYKWEAAPGRPIVQEPLPAATIDPWMSPLRPPPGVRKPTSWPLVESAFEVFEPEPVVQVQLGTESTQLAGRFLKKLNRLRRRSMVAAACFRPDASRAAVEHSGQLFATVEDLDRYNCASYDSSTESGMVSRCSVSTCDHPGTPYSTSTSFESSFSDPASRTRINTNMIAAVSSSEACSATSARPSTEYSCLGDNGSSGGHDKSTLPGPRECAWHQAHDEDPGTCGGGVPLETLQLRRSYSALIPALLRHSASTSSRNLKQLTLGRTFRRYSTKATKQTVQVDLEKM